MCPNLIKDELIENIYESAIDSDRIAEAMTSIADEFQSSGIQALVYSSCASNVFLCMSGRVDPAADEDYLRHYHLSDFRTRRVVRAKPGVLYEDSDFVTAKERRGSPFHQEFLKRYDCERVLLVTTPISRELTFVLAVARSAKQSDFESGTRRQVLASLPHLRRVAQIRLRILHEKARAESAEALVNLFTFAVVRMNAHGLVSYANSAAKNFLNKQSIAQMRDRRLTFRGSENTSRFYDALEHLAAEVICHGRRTLATIRISDPDSEQYLDALICPLPISQRDTPASEPGMAVYFFEPGHARGRAPAIQASLYGFTPAERRCAELLSNGESIDEIGSRLNVARNTVRAHLRSIFGKTGTNRQGEFVSLMTRDLAALAELLDVDS